MASLTSFPNIFHHHVHHPHERKMSPTSLHDTISLPGVVPVSQCPFFLSNSHQHHHNHHYHRHRHHANFKFTKHFLSESFSLGLLLFFRKLFRAKRNQTKMTSKDYNVLTYPEGFALTCPCQVGRVPGARVVRGGQGGQGGQVLLQGGGVHAQHFVAHKQEAWEVGKV